MVVGAFIWLTIATLKPPLPSPSNPLIFYSPPSNNLKICLLRALKHAKHSIFFQIYGLTDPDLIGLLSQKISQGLKVQIFYDKKGSKPLPKNFPATPMTISGLMHRKIFLFDDTRTFFGSANCTTQSLTMHDNLLIGIYNKEVTLFLQKSSEDMGRFSLGEIDLEIYLLPDFKGRAIEALIHCIREAKTKIQIAMFTLTHPLLVKELVEAKQRGVHVCIALDRCTAKGASKQQMENLFENGAAILLSQGDQLLHHKWAFIDDKTFILGSANWTKAAFEKNQDCLMIFHQLDPRSKKVLKKIWNDTQRVCLHNTELSHRIKI